MASTHRDFAYCSVTTERVDRRTAECALKIFCVVFHPASNLIERVESRRWSGTLICGGPYYDPYYCRYCCCTKYCTNDNVLCVLQFSRNVAAVLYRLYLHSKGAHMLSLPRSIPHTNGLLPIPETATTRSGSIHATAEMATAAVPIQAML